MKQETRKALIKDAYAIMDYADKNNDIVLYQKMEKILEKWDTRFRIENTETFPANDWDISL